MKKILLSITLICSFVIIFPGDAEGQRRKSRRSKKAKVVSVSKRSGYIRGPRGGCYYINRNGNKTYVSRSLCN